MLILSAFMAKTREIPCWCIFLTAHISRSVLLVTISTVTWPIVWNFSLRQNGTWTSLLPKWLSQTCWKQSSRPHLVAEQRQLEILCKKSASQFSSSNALCIDYMEEKFPLWPGSRTDVCHFTSKCDQNCLNILVCTDRKYNNFLPWAWQQTRATE